MAELPKSQRPASARSRWRPRAFPILIFVFTAIALAWFFESQATTTIIFVRHADTDPPVAAVARESGLGAPSGRPGPTLSARGRVRAELLADFLEDVDVVAGVDAIYASDFLPTQETAAPLADRLGVEVTVADHHAYETFMQDVLHTHKGDVVLVVTHADTMAPLIAELHGSKRVPPIAPDEYDNVYVVIVPWFGKVKTLRFRYGLAAPLDDIERYLEADGGPQSQIP
ncbi:MAG TPA: phosphoglycerate mutase family protein [Gammaproteobacteria bacterium]